MQTVGSRGALFVSASHVIFVVFLKSLFSRFRRASMDTTLPSAPLSSSRVRDRTHHYLNATLPDSPLQYRWAEQWSYILVDLGDSEVAPVDEGDHLSLWERLSVGSFNQNSRSIPNLLRAHLCVLHGHRGWVFHGLYLKLNYTFLCPSE